MPMNFQGQEYSYASVRFAMMGNSDVLGVTSFSYKVKRTVENIMGAGDEPIGYSKGAKEYEGSFTITGKTWKAMCEANGVSTLTDIPAFNAVIALANGTDPISTIEFMNINITEDGLEGSTGDNLLSVEIPFVFTGLKANWGTSS